MSKRKKRSNNKPTQPVKKRPTAAKKKKDGKIVFLSIVIGLCLIACGIGGYVLFNSFVAECEHEKVVDIRIEPTCEEDGWTEGAHCAKCGKTIVKPKIVQAIGHYYGAWTQTKAATCEEDGEQIRVCTRDESHVETQAIPALGHEYDTDGKCIRCSQPYALAYELNEDDTYTVTGIGAITSQVVVIPAEYNGKAVTAIAAYAFENQRFIGEVVIPESVTTVGEYAFKGCDNLDDIYVEATRTEASAQAWATTWNSLTGNSSHTIHYGLGENWEYDANGEPQEIRTGVDLPIGPIYETKGIYDTPTWNVI